MKQKNDASFFAGRGRTYKPVYGMRNWKIDNLGRLTGMMFKAVWTPGLNQARCLAQSRASATGQVYTVNVTVTSSQTEIATLGAPDHDMSVCPHGFYAYYDGSRDYHERGDVTGIIRGTGEAVVGDKGFRCMQAEILAIKFSGTVSEWARNRIRTLYPDVAVFSTVGQMLAEYPTTADGLEYRLDDDPDFWTREA